MVEWWYNTTYHTTTKMTHFEALYGYPPRNLLSFVPSTSSNVAVDKFLCTREQIINLLKENLTEAQNRMKIYADKQRIERQLEVGDWVYLRLQPYR